MVCDLTGPGTGADPYAYMRQAIVPTDPNAALRMWQEQQLKARQLVLQQQAASAAAAASKTQREVSSLGNAPHHEWFEARLVP